MAFTLSRWLLGRVLVILIEGWALPIHILFNISYFFVNIILILFCLLSLSFIAKGLSMCRLGGVITT